MQNKYKMPSDVRRTVISIVQGYDRRKIDLQRDEERIISLGGGKYEEKNGERVFLPSGKGGKSSVVENQALELMRLHDSWSYRCNKAIDESLAALPLVGYNPELAKKVREKIFLSCQIGRQFNFEYSGLTGISRRTFYRQRNRFLFYIAKKLEYI